MIKFLFWMSLYAIAFCTAFGLFYALIVGGSPNRHTNDGQKQQTT